MTQLIILRHAETVENIGHRCQGQNPGTLSDYGQQQAALLGQRLEREGRRFDRCICSDLDRVLQTIRLMRQYYHYLPEPIPDLRLRERYFGSLQGRVFPKELTADTLPPETEPVDALWGRVGSLVEELKTQYPGQKVLLVSHGFTIRVLVAYLLGLSREQVWEVPNVQNTSLSSFRYTQNQWQQEYFNDYGHLSAPLNP